MHFEILSGAGLETSRINLSLQTGRVVPCGQHQEAKLLFTAYQGSCCQQPSKHPRKPASQRPHVFLRKISTSGTGAGPSQAPCSPSPLHGRCLWQTMQS